MHFQGQMAKAKLYCKRNDLIFINFCFVCRLTISPVGAVVINNKWLSILRYCNGAVLSGHSNRIFLDPYFHNKQLAFYFIKFIF